MGKIKRKSIFITGQTVGTAKVEFFALCGLCGTEMNKQVQVEQDYIHIFPCPKCADEEITLAHAEALRLKGRG